MIKVIVIAGATGVGKTDLSIKLAKKFNAEIVNADASQFRKNLNIGTAKISEDEKEGVIHHLFDIVALALAKIPRRLDSRPGSSCSSSWKVMILPVIIFWNGSTASRYL